MVLFSNGSITFFIKNGDTFKKFHFDNINWSIKSYVNIDKGFTRVDTVKVFMNIPKNYVNSDEVTYPFNEGVFTVKAGDYMVKGTLNKEITSLSDIKGTKYYIVKGVIPYSNHLEIEGV